MGTLFPSPGNEFLTSPSLSLLATWAPPNDPAPALTWVPIVVPHSTGSPAHGSPAHGSLPTAPCPRLPVHGWPTSGPPLVPLLPSLLEPPPKAPRPRPLLPAPLGLYGETEARRHHHPHLAILEGLTAPPPAYPTGPRWQGPVTFSPWQMGQGERGPSTRQCPYPRWPQMPLQAKATPAPGTSGQCFTCVPALCPGGPPPSHSVGHPPALHPSSSEHHPQHLLPDYTFKQVSPRSPVSLITEGQALLETCPAQVALFWSVTPCQSLGCRDSVLWLCPCFPWLVSPAAPRLRGGPPPFLVRTPKHGPRPASLNSSSLFWHPRASTGSLISNSKT